MDYYQLAGVLMLMAFFWGAMIYARSVRRLSVTLARMEAATKVVAQDLADTHDRADQGDSDVPGSSADAALRSGPKETS